MAHLICAQVLHRVDIVKRELDTVDLRINPLDCGLEVSELVKISSISVGMSFVRTHVRVPADPLGHKPHRASTPVRRARIWTAVSDVISPKAYVTPRRPRTLSKVQGYC